MGEEGFQLAKRLSELLLPARRSAMDDRDLTFVLTHLEVLLATVVADDCSDFHECPTTAPEGLEVMAEAATRSEICNARESAVSNAVPIELVADGKRSGPQERWRPAWARRFPTLDAVSSEVYVRPDKFKDRDQLYVICD